jgi:hypothetical protein
LCGRASPALRVALACGRQEVSAGQQEIMRVLEAVEANTALTDERCAGLGWPVAVVVCCRADEVVVCAGSTRC